MNNIQKAFKTKSKLRGMANGGIMEENVGGVRTFTDQRAAGSGARPYTPSSTAGSMSVVGMAPAQRAEMDASIAKYRAEAAQAHEQRMGRAPDPTTALANALNKVGTSPTGTTPASAPTSPLRAPARSLPPITVTPPPVTAAAVPQLPTTTVFPPSTAMGGFRSPTPFAEDFYMQTPRFRDGGMHETREYYPHEPMIDGTRGGLVRGPGGPTDDKVGPVMLSDGEYVLPADTVEAVGKENLDALREATHEFVDPKKKPKKGLRGMASGGVFYVDPEGNVSRGTMPPGREMVPYQPPRPQAAATKPPTESPRRAGRLSRLATPVTVALEGKNVYDAYQTGGAQAAGDEAMMSGARVVGASQGAKLGGSLPLPGALRGLTAVAGGAAGYLAPDAVANSQLGKDAVLLDAYSRQIEEGLRPKFDARTNTVSTADGRVFGSGRLESNPHLQLAGYVGSRAQQALRDKEVLFNPTPQVLEAAGILLPEQADGAAPQPRPSEGSPDMSNTPAGVRTSSAGMPDTPVEPGSYQSRRLAEMGVPVDQQNLAPVTEGTRRNLLREGGGMPGQYVNLGSYGGDANIYGTASTPGGRIDTFTGVGTPAQQPAGDPILDEVRSALRAMASQTGAPRAAPVASRAREINERYDRLAKQLSGMYSRRGQGNLARRLIEVEQLRANALDADARNQSSLRGQDLSAASAAAGTNARMAQAMAGLAGRAAGRESGAKPPSLRDLIDLMRFENELMRFEDERARDARDVGDSRADRNNNVLNEYIATQFGEDSAEGREFSDYFRATNPNFTELTHAEFNSILPAVRERWEADNVAKETLRRFGLPVPVGGLRYSDEDMPIAANDNATWGDWWNSFRPFRDNARTARAVLDGDGNPIAYIDKGRLTRRPDGSYRADILRQLSRKKDEQ